MAKDKLINLRVTEAERQTLHIIAKKEKKSITDLLLAPFRSKFSNNKKKGLSRKEQPF